MASAVFSVLSSAGMCDEVEAIVFDTTSSNSGSKKGSVKLLQDKLNRPILPMACRHHIAELVIKHASEKVRGPSSGMNYIVKSHSLITEYKSYWIIPSSCFCQLLEAFINSVNDL